MARKPLFPSGTTKDIFPIGNGKKIFVHQYSDNTETSALNEYLKYLEKEPSAAYSSSKNTAILSENHNDPHIANAKTLIDEIEKNNGAVSKETWAKLNDEVEAIRSNPLRDEDSFEIILAKVRKFKKLYFGKATTGDYSLSLYKNPSNESVDDLISNIKAKQARKIGDIEFSPTNQNFQVDDNGNILLKSKNAHLDDAMFIGGCGDVLLSSNGDVIKSMKGRGIIFPCDAFGYYPVMLFENTTDKITGKKTTTNIQYNFLDAKGHFITRDNYSKSKEPELWPIHRTYRDEFEGQTFHKTSQMLPTGYVLSNSDKVSFYPSATALLLENRSRIQNGFPAILSKETEEDLIKQHYERFDEVEEVKKKLQASFNNRF